LTLFAMVYGDELGYVRIPFLHWEIRMSKGLSGRWPYYGKDRDVRDSL